VRQMLGAVDRGHAVRIVEAIAAGDGAALVGAVDGLRGLGLSATGTLDEMAALLQQMAVLQAVPDAIDADDPDAPDAQRLAASIAADTTQLLYSIALHGRAELGLAPDEYSGLVMVLLRMLAFRPSDAAAPAPGPAAAPAPRPAQAPAQPAVVAPAPVLRVAAPASEPPPWLDAPFDDEVREPAAVAREPEAAYAASPVASPVSAFTPTAVGARWAELVRTLVEAGSISAFGRELALQAQCVALDEQAVPVVCRLRVEREALRAAAPCEKLQAALAEALQRSVRLEVEAGAADDSPAKRDAAERARRQAQAEQIIHDDPLVRALMAQYKTARIVPGSVKPH
ncbi:MAG TPA: DNA polymerase III subunit gamma/tau C-terminal domain-containing protein, partial [Burkholderiaceae bacterium]|nr:DNA polymerase III subunit gamma/tau C-terminal domain-containing protein [Burkholderiaceae bacterium]